MRRILIAIAILLVSFGVLLAGGWIDVAHARWPVKTLRDRDRGAVRMAPVDATVSELTRVTRPPDGLLPGRARLVAQERTVYRVRARLRRVFDGSDGDIHLILADPAEPSRVMIAEIPHPLLALGSGLGKVFEIERRQIARHRHPRGELVEVTGVGFFDYYPRGRQANGLELHPVLALGFPREESPQKSR